MKNFYVVGMLGTMLLAACGPKPNSAQSEAPKAIAAAEIPSTPPPAKAPAPTPVQAVPQPSAPGAVINTSTVPDNPTDLAEVQRQFLLSVESAIKKAEAGLKTPVTRFVENQTHSYFAEYTGKYTYDIKKTESIVSPLVGSVSWGVNWYDNGVLTNIPTTLEARYAYQNGQWVIKELIRRVNDEKNYPADEYLPFFQ